MTDIILKEKYERLLKSGMFWEICPNMTGEWERDKKEWIERHDNLHV